MSGTPWLFDAADQIWTRQFDSDTVGTIQRLGVGFYECHLITGPFDSPNETAVGTEANFLDAREAVENTYRQWMREDRRGKE